MPGTLVITERYTLIVSDLKFLPVLKFRLAATVVAFLAWLSRTADFSNCSVPESTVQFFMDER